MGTPSCLAGWARGDTALLLPWSLLNPPCCPSELGPCVTVPTLPSRLMVTAVTQRRQKRRGLRPTTMAPGTSGPPADPSNPAAVATQEGTRTATVPPHPAAPGGPRWSRERLPGRKGSWPPSSSLRAPPATARPVTRTGRDGRVSSERAAGRGPRPRCPPGPGPAARDGPSAARSCPAAPAGATAPTPQLPAGPGDAPSPLPSPHPRCDTPLSPRGAAGAQAGCVGQDGLRPQAGTKSRCPTLPCMAPGWARPGQECPMARRWWHMAMLPVQHATNPGRHGLSPQGQPGG